MSDMDALERNAVEGQIAAMRREADALILDAGTHHYDYRKWVGLHTRAIALRDNAARLEARAREKVTE